LKGNKLQLSRPRAGEPVISSLTRRQTIRVGASLAYAQVEVIDFEAQIGVGASQGLGEPIQQCVGQRGDGDPTS